MDYIFQNIYCILVGYVFIQIVLYFAIERNCCWIEKNEEVVFIKDEKHRGPFAMFSAIVEYGILNRYSIFGYKNATKNNSKLLASGMMSVFILIAFIIVYRLLCSSYICPDLPVIDFIVAWFGFIISSFIIERKILYDKWQYLAKLYNDVISLNDEKEEDKRDVLNAALAIDLLDMEMWSHRSFSEVFFSQMEEAVELDQIKLPRIVDFDVCYIKHKSVPKKEARKLLLKLQKEKLDK